MDVGFSHLSFVHCCTVDSKSLHVPTEGKTTFRDLGSLQTANSGRKHGQPKGCC